MIIWYLLEIWKSSPGDILYFRFGPYFVEPLIAGLHPKTNEPYVASCDLIGCPMVPEDFVVVGTSEDQLLGEKTFIFSLDFILLQSFHCLK